MKYRLGEWQVILDAYCYEIKDDPIASDYTFDMCCQAVSESNNTSIPNFTPSTGQWIYDVIKEKNIKNILEKAYKKYKMLGEGTSVIHLIDKRYINEV
jgi:hypothetical protein